MDRLGKIMVGLCAGLLLAWTFWSQRAFKPLPIAARTNVVANSSSTTGIQTLPPGSASTALPNSATAVPAAPASPGSKPTRPESTLVLNSPNLRLTFTSHGGGISLIEIPNSPETVACGAARGWASTNVIGLNRGATRPIYELGAGLSGDGDYDLSLLDQNRGVRAEKLLPSGLKITKDFVLTSNYQFNVVTKLENKSPQPLALPEQLWSIGTANPVNPHDAGTMVGICWFNGTKSYLQMGWGAGGGCTSGPRENWIDGASNVVWASSQNQYFSVITLPDSPAVHVSAHRVQLPPPSATELARDPRAQRQPIGADTQLHFSPAPLAPGQILQRTFSVYAGPKEYFTLSRLDPKFDLVMDYTGFSGFFAKFLLLGMNGLHSLGLNYGWSIIVLTLIIKILFWPLTNISTRSMKRMGELQPQMKAIQEKYKDDPKKMNEKTLAYMRENKINPAAGCLPLLVQFPVFIGLFTMLQAATELRGSSFLWMCDLSAPDTLFMIPGLMLPFNLMPLLYAATAVWQTHMTPMSPQMDPVQQKMMRYMPLMFLFIFYNYSCGLALYWTVQNLLSILQMKLTNTTPQPPSAPAGPLTKAAKRA